MKKNLFIIPLLLILVIIPLQAQVPGSSYTGKKVLHENTTYNILAKDTLPPDPRWIESCDGSISGEGGLDEATVEDMPRTNERSNLASIVFNTQESFNYNFSHKDFTPGVTSKTTWKAWVNDISENAKAVITFTDNEGNDTTIIIEYNALKIKIRPDLNFGRFAIGESKQMKTWLVNQTSRYSPVVLDLLNLKFQNQGFNLINNKLPLIIPYRDSIQITVNFTATQYGDFIDSIGCGWDCHCDCGEHCLCGITYKSKMRAFVGKSRINVTHFNFGNVPLNTSAMGMIEIRNIEKELLIITGYTNPKNTVFMHMLPVISELNPLLLASNQTYEYFVNFLPTAEQIYTDSMYFFSNSEKLPIPIDSVADLYGRGIKATDINHDIGNSFLNNAKILNFRVYPNPFESGTTFSFDSDLSGNSVDIEIYDILGSKITTLNSLISEGENRINWNGRDRSGNKLRSGVYFARLKNTAVYSQISLMIFIQ